MIRPLPQAYLVPPHWSPIRRHTIDGTKARVPKKSSSWSFWRKESILASLLGALKEMAIMIIVTAPMGYRSLSSASIRSNLWKTLTKLI